MTRFEEARRMATANPMLTQADIARAVGLSRNGVHLALKRVGLVVRDGRGDQRIDGRGRGGSARVLMEARRKAESHLPLTREERHVLWQDYRHRERESAA